MQSRLKFLENSFKINMLAPAWKCGGEGEGEGGTMRKISPKTLHVNTQF